jgi:hypothetical protein
MELKISKRCVFFKRGRHFPRERGRAARGARATPTRERDKGRGRPSSCPRPHQRRGAHTTTSSPPPATSSHKARARTHRHTQKRSPTGNHPRLHPPHPTRAARVRGPTPVRPFAHHGGQGGGTDGGAHPGAIRIRLGEESDERTGPHARKLLLGAGESRHARASARPLPEGSATQGVDRPTHACRGGGVGWVALSLLCVARARQDRAPDRGRRSSRSCSFWEEHKPTRPFPPPRGSGAGPRFSARVNQQPARPSGH